MTAGEVLVRLAAQGFWGAPNDPAALARLKPFATRLDKPIDEIARVLSRNPDSYGAAVRRQLGTRVLWYPRKLREVLDRCTAAPYDEPLLAVLGLHESDAPQLIRVQHNSNTMLGHGVVMDDSLSLGVSFTGSKGSSFPAPSGTQSPGDLVSRSTAFGSNAEPFTSVPAWPRIDAPSTVRAKSAFDVVIGFCSMKQAGVIGGQVVIPARPGAVEVRLSVELSSGPELQAPDGWTRSMTVRLEDVLSASVTFRLEGMEPSDRASPSLTMLEVRYVLDGTICGTAAKPIIVLASSGTPPSHPAQSGEDWLATPASATPVVLIPDEFAPDLTIEITKPDRNDASGAYACHLVSSHPLTTFRGPFPMDLGQDAKTYAKSIVEEIRLFTNNALLDNTLESIGRTVAQCLPRAVFDALAEVAALVAPAVPAVLIVSAEPFVPWELAWVEPPLDLALPRYLGAQVILGRWLRVADATAGPSAVSRPATQPVARMIVRNMAVMVAWYKAESGLKQLIEAEKEARMLVAKFDGVALSATAESLRQLLNATLARGFESIGGPEAVHFAGHGDFDPNRAEGSALFLQDGTAVRSTLFRSARYGGERQPLLFLNACMLGIGGELLGDMAGFPGNSLRGGFGGVLGALWEVDDAVARDFALEFWQRALPEAPAQGEPIGKILQDLRAKYLQSGLNVPVSTYLSYVYYGHPRLHLQRAATGSGAGDMAAP
jgi:hypothetical protein